ncbi:hypothetical protein OPV22_019673 [Ensete ventricosum]|uniref:Uncharacterized protein n=1 Tax=Ensete ventricosum TaxID=4639 RepID=A0AAV8QC64_ENSVE|nr:hypothetical protein OPV22_019673 [Ensete ventricosum]
MLLVKKEQMDDLKTLPLHLPGSCSHSIKKVQVLTFQRGPCHGSSFQLLGKEQASRLSSAFESRCRVGLVPAFVRIGRRGKRSLNKLPSNILAAAISAWSFLFTTISGWRINPDYWKGSPFSELGILELQQSMHRDSLSHENSNHGGIMCMQSMEDKILSTANDQQDLFRKILDHVQTCERQQVYKKEELEFPTYLRPSALLITGMGFVISNHLVLLSTAYRDIAIAAM